MNTTRIAFTLATLAVALPSTGRAQSLDRRIEQMAETIAASAERLAANVERAATRLADRIERDMAEKERRMERHRRGDDRGDREFQVASRLDTTVAFSADGLLDLTLVSGEILVTGWERGEARIRASSERGRLEYELSSSRVTIEVHSDRDNWGRGRYGETRYEVSVPRGARVRTRSTSGDITVRNTEGEVEASSTSGEITVEGAARRIALETVSGDINGTALRGEVEANSVSGSIELRTVTGAARLGSTSGDVVLLDATSPVVEMSTTSGEVSYDGALAPDGRYEFTSHSGSIDLVVPAAATARFSVATWNGTIDSEFPITLQPGTAASRRPRRFEFTVGSGGPRVTAESFSGDVDIRTRR